MSRIVIIIDAQNGFVTPSSAHVLQPLARAQYEFDEVIFTKFHNPESSPFRRILDYQKIDAGTEEAELAITPRADAVMIDRPYYTCVTAELLDYLKKRDATDVYICGIATEACVLKTALDLFEKDITPWIVTDLCASDEDVGYHELGLRLLGKLIGAQHLVTQQELFGEGVDIRQA